MWPGKQRGSSLTKKKKKIRNHCSSRCISRSWKLSIFSSKTRLFSELKLGTGWPKNKQTNKQTPKETYLNDLEILFPVLVGVWAIHLEVFQPLYVGVSVADFYPAREDRWLPGTYSLVLGLLKQRHMRRPFCGRVVQAMNKNRTRTVHCSDIQNLTYSAFITVRNVCWERIKK